MRPTNLIYGVGDRPPAFICFVNAVQLLTPIAPNLVYVILVMTGVGAGPEAVTNAVSVALVVSGVGCLLQAFPGRILGSGYLIGIGPAAAYVPISIVAFKTGGLSLLGGMIIVAGLAEIAFAQMVQRFRAFFPAEISGLCILLIGMFIGILAIRAVFGLDPQTMRSTASRLDLAITAFTFALMAGLNVWGRGLLRMLCAIIGVACGYVLAVLIGAADPNAMRSLGGADCFALPRWSLTLPTIQLDLLVPFIAAGLTCALRTMGDVSVAQKINDRDWVRPDMASIRNGMVANGLATVLSGFAGGLGGNTQSSGIGMSNAAGVTSRRVGYWLGGILIVMSMIPVISAVMVATPRPVIAAVLLFTASFVMTSGIQVITTRLLDGRRTFIVGLALTLSLGREILPFAFEGVPPILQPLTSSGLVLGLVTALVLNAVFRIGVRTRAAIRVEPAANAHEAVRAFLEEQGAKWGARRDVIERAIFGTEQSLESIFGYCNVRGAARLEAAFDEFNLDIRISYRGDDFVLSERRPTEDEILASDDGLRLLAGYMIQQNADHVRASRDGERTVLAFHFQH